MRICFIAALCMGSLFFSACNERVVKIENVSTPEAEQQNATDSVVYTSDDLTIRKISNQVYEHNSFLNTDSFGRVPCNGMIVIDNGEAVVFDTPADSISSKELLDFLVNKQHYKVNAVIATHFHADCVAGLKEFHQAKIPSYAQERTIAFLKEQNSPFDVPLNGFQDTLELKVGNKKVYAGFFGEGHTKDNIVGYFPDDKVLFGGCLIKEQGAGKGNLEDANEKDWAATVEKVRNRFPETQIIIPGHGKTAGPELFDYTIELFK